MNPNAMTKSNTASMQSFQTIVWDYYHHYGRSELLWRQPDTQGVFNPYYIAVSEIMLQQTQVSRVTPKYQQFIQAFPTIQTLAEAPLAEVLTHWSGLGYNRRAKFLWDMAGMVMDKHDGSMPRTTAELRALPGIGVNTAGAIIAYAYNEPVIFIETNIRTVFIDYFFADTEQVTDAMLLPYIQEALPIGRAREWYWALMDYGSYLKKAAGNAARRSAHHTKQSTFQGSRRQVRGAVVKQLIKGPQSLEELRINIIDDRLESVLDDLQKEGLVCAESDVYRLMS